MPKILIVDDHEVVRAGVARVIEKQGITFGEASKAEEALEMVGQEDWNLVVLDLSLGDRSGLDLLKEFKRIRPALPVLVLTMHSEEQYARRALRAGAAGYLAKDSPREELVKAVDRVMEGGRYISPGIAEMLILDLEKDAGQPLHHLLSDRELEVMCLIASGKTVGEIAKLLELSDKTISTYRARLLEKMKMKSTAEIIRYAIRNHLSS